MPFNWEIPQDELDAFHGQAESIFGTIGDAAMGLGSKVAGMVDPEHVTNAIERAGASGDIGEGASELYAGALNVVSDIAQGFGMDMEDVPEYTGESATAFWRGLAGDESARETPVTTRSGEETTLGGVKGYGEMEDIAADVRTGAEGLTKAAQLGALNEIWDRLNAGATKPITSTANTIEQLLNIDNRGLI